MPSDTRPQEIRIWAEGKEHFVGEAIEIRGEVVACRPGEKSSPITVSLLKKGTTYAEQHVVEEPSTDRIHFAFRVAVAPVRHWGTYSAKARGYSLLKTPGVEEGQDPPNLLWIESASIEIVVKNGKR